MEILENGLIPVFKDERGQVVDGRDLHEFLEVGTKFTDWIKERIQKYGFIENEDYSTSSEKREVANKGFKIITEYLLTLDTAKEIAMVQNNEKGSEARKYFISIEKKYKQSPKLSPELQSIIMLDQRTVETIKRIDSLENEMPLFNVECKELQSLVRKVAIEALGGYRSLAYNNNSLRGRVYSDVQHQLKREFGVERYEAIKRIQLETANKIVAEYRTPTILNNEIAVENNQLNFIGGKQ